MFKPDYIFERIWDIEVEFLTKLGIKALFLDVDNTLTAHGAPLPEKSALEWLDRMKQADIKLIILSNNTPQRVAPFAKRVGLDFITGTKPQKKIYLDAIGRVGVPKENCAAVGDQLFTDVWGANRAGVISILTKPLYEDTDRFIRVKRVLEKPLLRRYERRVYR